ncbi:leucine-rich repeat neuronal protein 4 [Engystomops pustulosus]|uniref:leucine-rich repeat neuronal protein 4 n=1 Tax=Engystomops pustulosus TaxID=76066 RepID=UPI003AFAC190
MFTLLLLVSKMGMLMASLNSTDRTVTVSKNLTEEVNITDTQCGEQCNVKCHLLNQNLDVLPTCLPRTVEDLDLSFNNITVIEDQDVVDFSNLRILSLSHNQIKELHWKMLLLPQLESLDLSFNQLSTAPKCLMLKKLRILSLAGNPILHFYPSTYLCFPNLVSLNLSMTSIGINSSEDIDHSPFALNTTQGQEDSLKSLHVLDLSGTYITSVNHSWITNLSNLRELLIREMVNMEVLEDELFTWLPDLQILNCAGSKRLRHIRTEIFDNATNLVYLNFQNCNLKEFSPWKINSPPLTIDLHGNPLTCDCQLDWLFLNVNVNLKRANETFCSRHKGDVSTISMVALHEICKLSHGEPSDKTQASVTSSTGVMGTYFMPGITEDSLTSTLTMQETGQKYVLSENTTDFMTTVLQSETSTAQSGGHTPETSSISDVDTSPKELTLFISTTDGPITEHRFPETGSSNGDQTEITRDYPEEYEEEETQPRATTAGSQMIACDYDHCRHLQTPCSELQLLSPCFCPGLSGDDTIPDPPHLQGIFEITDTSAQIRWCSPNSIVDKYQLLYGSEGLANTSVNNIYVTMRQYTLYNLAPYTEYNVCVLALNKKGNSIPINGPSRTPCAEFRTKPSYILILSILSAVGGLCLVTIVVLSACLYKACKNRNLSKYDTHLVSYKNPAFEYQCTIPSYH